MSLACHLVAFTLLAGRRLDAPIPAALDGVFAVDTAAPATPIEDHAPPPRARPAPVPRPRLRRLGRAAPVRRSVVSQAPPAPPGPVEAPPAAMAAARSGSGVSPQAPAPASPPLVTAAVARSLRVYDTFPRMPEILRMAPHVEAVEAEICVSEQGSVRQVRLRGGSDALERVLRDAIATWRYRPYVVDGVASPFCHVLRLAYRAQDRAP